MSTELPPKSSKNSEGVKVSGDFSKAIDGVSAAGREDPQIWHNFDSFTVKNTIEMVSLLAKSRRKIGDHARTDGDTCHFSKLFSIVYFF